MLYETEPTHSLFQAFHDQELPNKRALCDELRDLIRDKRVAGRGPIADVLAPGSEQAAACSAGLRAAIRKVVAPTPARRVAPPALRVAAPAMKVTARRAMRAHIADALGQLVNRVRDDKENATEIGDGIIVYAEVLRALGAAEEED